MKKVLTPALLLVAGLLAAVPALGWQRGGGATPLSREAYPGYPASGTGGERGWGGWVYPTGGFRYPSPLRRSVFPAYGVVYGVAPPFLPGGPGAGGGPQWVGGGVRAGGANPPRSAGANPRTKRIRVGGGFFGGGYFYPTGGFRYPSPLQRSVFPSDACYGIYSANVQPGNAYALNLHLPQAGAGTRVYLADRLPTAAGAHLRPLPMSSRRGSYGRGLYRWRFGIAPNSYGLLVYIVVVAPWLCGGVPPYYGVSLDPWGNYGAAASGSGGPVMQADGPQHLVLAPEERSSENGPLGSGDGPARALPGDIVANPDFTRGLLDWEAVRGGYRTDSAKFVRVTSQGLELSGSGGGRPSGVRQSLGTDVAGAAAVVLQARLKVGPGGDGSSAPALTIAICYRDAAGKRHCGAAAFRRRFVALPPGAGTAAGVQPVPPGGWYRETFDLMSLRPRPARVDSLSLIAPVGQGLVAWVRDVHLLVQHGEH